MYLGFQKNVILLNVLRQHEMLIKPTLTFSDLRFSRTPVNSSKACKKIHKKHFQLQEDELNTLPSFLMDALAQEESFSQNFYPHEWCP
ncbi:MAG: hypothetical protein AAGB12_15740 [Pseudomonadota bacterium]